MRTGASAFKMCFIFMKSIKSEGGRSIILKKTFTTIIFFIIERMIIV